MKNQFSNKRILLLFGVFKDFFKKILKILYRHNKPHLPDLILTFSPLCQIQTLVKIPPEHFRFVYLI